MSVIESNPVEVLDEMYVCLYCTLCCRSLAALILCILASCVNPKMIHKGVEDTNHEKPTSSMAPLLVMLPGPQFLCWSTPRWGL